MNHCSVAGCRSPAKRGGLCWGHVKRRQRHGVVAVTVVGVKELKRAAVPFFEAVYTYLEAETDSAETFARTRIMDTGQAFFDLRRAFLERRQPSRR